MSENVKQTVQGKDIVRIHLYTRGDDCGSNHSANKAILEACDHGILKNVSFMIPGPCIQEAAELFAHRKDVCHGLHVTVNAEWDSIKWGAVSEPERVPSLLDDHGFFFQTTRALKEHGPKLDEIMVETQVQLDKATRLGLHIRYAEMHMGFGWILDGLQETYQNWCKEKGLMDSIPLGKRLPDVEMAGDPVECLIERLKAADSGYYALIGHPAYDNPEMRALGHDGYPGDVVATEREWERRMFCDERIIAFCSEKGIRPTRYDEYGYE